MPSTLAVLKFTTRSRTLGCINCKSAWPRLENLLSIPLAPRICFLIVSGCGYAENQTRIPRLFAAETSYQWTAADGELLPVRRILYSSGAGAEGRIMKLISSRLALQPAILAFLFAAAGHAEESGAANSSRQGFHAKLEYCQTCHGLSGEGYRGYYPMPRLAGSSPSISKISCGPLSSVGG